MTEHTQTPQIIALLATGDEIKNGDILNTNAQEIALRLFNHAIVPGTHMVVGDNIQEIQQAIGLLLKNHPALIITGGLGPTSDDVTRQALAAALNKKLLFDDATWEDIVQRLKNFGYQTPPESNKQQALFPEGAIIIANPNGTAAGCMIQHDQKWIFMLPGPPAECLPMVDNIVIPALIKYQFQQQFYQHKWLLFGVSEGEIAETLDAIAKPYDGVTGYRICYPYIEFKIYSYHLDNFSVVVKKIQDVISKYIINEGKFTASEYLKKLLPTLPFNISIDDQATGGLLAATLLTPETYHKILFTSHPETTQWHIKIAGLEEFWQNKISKTTNLDITIQDKFIHREIPFRGLRVKAYAVELICKKIYDCIKTKK